MRGKEGYEKDTTTVHHDGSGASFCRRDGLGSTRPSGSGEYGSAHHTPQTSVDPTANIKAKFSEAMKERSINTSTFYLLEGHFTYEQLNCTASATTVCEDLPAPVAATVRYNDDTKTAILNPTESLTPCTEYTAVVEGTGDGDMKAVKDRGGTPLATDYIFYFRTSNGSGSGGGGDHPCF